MFVPVVDNNQNLLMPTTPSRAHRWIKSGKATGFWKKGVFCVRLNVEPSGRETQDVAVGIDPGSKKEGFTVKSAAHTYLNVQADAVTWVKDVIETRRNLRKARRFRKTPCRKPCSNRGKSKSLPPSTKARWQWKVRICNWFLKMFPISCFVVEDVKVGPKKAGKHFSAVQMGKNWFYEELRKHGNVETRQGFETKSYRDTLGLKKSKRKLDNKFECHCVDSWALANSATGGHTAPDNTALLLVRPLRFHRRQLHMMTPVKGGVRKRMGGTRTLGFKRGSLVKHPKYGVTYVGGWDNRGISLHSLSGGKDGGRVTRCAKPKDIKFLTYTSWITG